MNRAPDRTLRDRDGTKSAERGGICNKTAGNRQEAMEDSLHFDIPVQQRMRPVRRVRAPQRAAERPELLPAEPINVYHWAAVALVTALMGMVMACAAGTPALARAAGFTSAVFGALGGVLVLGGVLRAMRLRRSQLVVHSSDVNGSQR
jgi:hypothetical protein